MKPNSRRWCPRGHLPRLRGQYGSATFVDRPLSAVASDMAAMSFSHHNPRQSISSPATMNPSLDRHPNIGAAIPSYLAKADAKRRTMSRAHQQNSWINKNGGAVSG